jgi:hypothetical protein
MWYGDVLFGQVYLVFEMLPVHECLYISKIRENFCYTWASFFDHALEFLKIVIIAIGFFFVIV